MMGEDDKIVGGGKLRRDQHGKPDLTLTLLKGEKREAMVDRAFPPVTLLH